MDIKDWVSSINEDKPAFGDFSSYDIEPKPIGVGGFSRVYRVKRNGKTYAMKVPSNIHVDIDQTIEMDLSANEDFKAEASNWAEASSKVPDYVVTLVDYNVDPFPWMVMELAQYSFRSYMNDGKATVSDIIEIIKCLDEVHKAGIVHRDIKPENVLRVGDRWKLTDFGLSKIMNSMTKSTNAFKGTPQYMAPEQVSKRKFGEIDQKTDIWQMGIMLYEVLMHKLPYPSMDFAELGMAIIGDGPDYKDAPKEYHPILSKALNKDKNKRFKTAGDFAEALSAVEAKRRKKEPATKTNDAARAVPVQIQSPQKQTINPKSKDDVPKPPAGPSKPPTGKKSSKIAIVLVIVVLIAAVGIGIVLINTSTEESHHDSTVHTVSYDVNGGTGSVPSQDVVEGASFIISSYSGTKSGLSFTGWSYNGNTYLPGDNMKMRTSNIKFTAVWTENVTIEGSELKVYGNANGDGKIDNSDISIIQNLVDTGKSAKQYPLADANQDGILTNEDVTQVRNIVNKVSTTVFYVNLHDIDGDGIIEYETRTVNYPVNSIFCSGSNNMFMMLYMSNIIDEVKGATYTNNIDSLYYDSYLNTEKVWRLGTSTKDIEFSSEIHEMMLARKATAVLTEASQNYVTSENEYSSAGFDVIRIDSSTTDLNTMVHCYNLLGFLFGKENRTDSIVDYSKEVMQKIDSVLSKEKQVNAVASSMTNYFSVNDSMYVKMIERSGGSYALKSGSWDDKRTAIRIQDYTEVFDYSQYSYNYVIHIRSYDAYSGTVDLSSLYTEYGSYIAEKWEHGWDGQYIVNNNIPILARLAYIISAFYDDVDKSWADQIHQRFVDKYFARSGINVSKLTFVYPAK